MQIYIHIPFCVRKCAYCDFLSFPCTEADRSVYVEALIYEINMADERGEAATVFFGGGTPSLLSPDEILRVAAALRGKFRISHDAEISLEANPGTVTREKLSAWKTAGINRLSLGLQSAKNEELNVLGRIHTWEDFTESYALAREAGFENINVDLMSALPGQTSASWRETLSQVAALEPEHISAYSLMIEEGTPFYNKYADDIALREKGYECSFLPSEEEERRMYYDTDEILRENGYHRYEISNYAKAGYECRHNCGYWTRADYRGFGLGAASLINEVRFKNTDDMKKYLSRDFSRKDEEALSVTSRMEEFMFLGLRLIKGISIRDFEEKFMCDYESVYGGVTRNLEAKKLIRRENGRVFLTDLGIDVSNYVLAEFML